MNCQKRPGKSHKKSYSYAFASISKTYFEAVGLCFVETANLARTVN